MLPVTYQFPAGILLIAGGLLACFFGYRLFRLVLVVFGFILGALFASSFVAPSNTVAMIVAVVVGGLAGGLLMFAAYFVGVFLVGAGLGALVLQAVWAQFFASQPNIFLLAFFAILGGVLAAIAQRYVIIVATAFGGAQTAIAGVVAVLASREPRRPAPDDVWIGHLGIPAVSRDWPFVAWLLLGVVGLVVQLSTGGGGKAVGRRRR